MTASPELGCTQRLTKAFKAVLNTIENIIISNPGNLDKKETKRFSDYKDFVIREYPNGLDHKDDFLAMYGRHRNSILNGKNKYMWLDEGKVILRSGDGIKGANPNLCIKLSHFYAVAAEHRDEMKSKGPGPAGFDKAYNYPDALILNLYRYLADVVPTDDKKKIDSYVVELETELGLRPPAAPIPLSAPDFGAIFQNIDFAKLIGMVSASQGQGAGGNFNIPFNDIASEVHKGLEKSGILGTTSTPMPAPTEMAAIIGSLGAFQSSVGKIMNESKAGVPLQAAAAAAAAAVKDIPNSAIPSGVAATFGTTVTAAIQEGKKEVNAASAPSTTTTTSCEVVVAATASTTSSSVVATVSSSPSPPSSSVKIEELQ